MLVVLVWLMGGKKTGCLVNSIIMKAESEEKPWWNVCYRAWMSMRD